MQRVHDATALNTELVKTYPRKNMRNSPQTTRTRLRTHAQDIKHTLLTSCGVLRLGHCLIQAFLEPLCFTLDFTNHYLSRNSTHAAALVTHIQLRVTKPGVLRPPHCTGSLIGLLTASPRKYERFPLASHCPHFISSHNAPVQTGPMLDPDSHVHRPMGLADILFN